MKFKGFYSVFKVVLLCFVILFISYQFALDPKLIGWVIISLGLLCMVILIASGTKLKSTWPDLVFGAIDNGVLAVMAIFGKMAGCLLAAGLVLVTAEMLIKF